MSSKRLSIATVTDGRPGNAVQARGLAEAIARLRDADIVAHDVDVKPLLRETLLRLTGRPLRRGPRADLVIGAGRRGNLVAAEARAGGSPAVAILRPSFPLNRYDAVVVPEHDGLTGANVLTTLGSLNALSAERIAGAAADLQPLPPRTLVALVGGPSRTATFEAEEEAALVSDLCRFAAEGYAIAATPSRRTPPNVIEQMRAAVPGIAIWDGTPPNPYPGWLHGAAAILVTADSVNMASEAAATGTPVFISGTDRIAPKFRRFHAALARRGITRPAAEGPAEWTYAPLREADRIAPLILERLGL